MQSSKPYSFIIDEPSEADLTLHITVKELINFTFGPYTSTTINMKMLQIVLHLMAHQLNILEQTVEIKEQDRAKAIEELKQKQRQELLTSYYSEMSLEEESLSSAVQPEEDYKYKRKDKKELKTIKRQPSDYISSEGEDIEEAGQKNKSALDETRDTDIIKSKSIKERKERDSKKRIDDTPALEKTKHTRESKHQKKEADIIPSVELGEQKKEQRIDKTEMTTKERWEDGTVDKSEGDEQRESKISKEKMASKSKKGKISDILSDSEQDRPKKSKDKTVIKSKKRTTKDKAPSVSEESENEITIVKKRKAKTLPISEDQKSDYDFISDESDKISIDKKRKNKIAKKSEKERQSGGTHILDTSEDETKEFKKSGENISRKSKKERRAEDMPVSATLDDKEEYKIKKAKEKKAIKSEKALQPDDARISDESGDNETYETQKSPKKTRQSEKRRQADEVSVTSEVEVTDKKYTKKSKEKAVKKLGKGRDIEDTNILGEAADDKISTGKKKKYTVEETTKSSKTAKDDLILDKSKDSGRTKSEERETKTKDVKANDTPSIEQIELSKTRKGKDKIKSPKRGTGKDSERLYKPEDDEAEIDKMEVKPRKSKTADLTGAQTKKDVVRSKSDNKYKGVKKRQASVAVARSRQGSVELATLSEFDILESKVKKLQQQTGPLPMPTMPDSKKLMEDVASGAAMLPAAMEAMQLHARIGAAEEGVNRMADLLGRLSAAGVLPPEASALVDQLHEKHAQLSRLITPSDEDLDFEAAMKSENKDAAERSTAIPVNTAATDVKSEALSVGYRPETAKSIDQSTTVDQATSIDQATSVALPALPLSKGTAFATQAKSSALARALTQDELVTHYDMNEAMKSLKEEMVKNIKTLTDRATASAERANNMARTVADKLETALDFNKRVDALNALSKDYAIQLKGFDSGLTTQLVSLHEQMKQMQEELREGLALYDMSDKLESNAVIELRRGYTAMGLRVHHILNTHSKFVKRQDKFAEELKKAIEYVEVLREQKADCDEVADGLRDKVDITRLRDIPDEATFEAIRNDLLERLRLCRGKFSKQSQAWAKAISDLSNIAKCKGEIQDLEDLEDYTQDELNALLKDLHTLEIALGVPKASLMVKQVPLQTRVEASQAPEKKKHYVHSFPTPSPTSTSHSRFGEDTPCFTGFSASLVPEERHACKRLVGGSHTMITDQVTREEMGSWQFHKRPNIRYTGFGADGHPYMMEEQLHPCVECNEILLGAVERPSGLDVPEIMEVGAGDQQPLDENEDKKGQQFDTYSYGI